MVARARPRPPDQALRQAGLEQRDAELDAARERGAGRTVGADPRAEHDDGIGHGA
jgi:hypothetical protein